MISVVLQVSTGYKKREIVAQVAYIFSSKQATSERRVGNDGHSEFTCGTQQSHLRKLDIKRERRIFDLEGSDRVHCVCATQRRGRTFGKTDMFDLSSPIPCKSVYENCEPAMDMECSLDAFG